MIDGAPAPSPEPGVRQIKLDIVLLRTSPAMAVIAQTAPLNLVRTLELTGVRGKFDHAVAADRYREPSGLSGTSDHHSQIMLWESHEPRIRIESTPGLDVPEPDQPGQILSSTCYKRPMATLENFRLVAFRSVATHLSFRKASEALYLTQPAVSAQIKALEEELGVQLFDRNCGRVSLTEAGAKLLEFAHQARALYARAEEELGRIKGEVSGVLALGASTTIAQYALPRRLRAFNSKNPGVEIQMISGNTEQIVAALLEQRIELGLIEGPPRSSEVHAEPYLADELVLIVPAGHEWAERGVLASGDLPHMPLLMRERGSGTRDIVLAALEKQGIRPNQLRILMELDSTEAIKSAVAAGLGAGFVSRWALMQDSRTGKEFQIVVIEGLRIHRAFQLTSLQRHVLASASAEFRRFLLAGVPD